MKQLQQPLYAADLKRLEIALNNYGAAGLIAKLNGYYCELLTMLNDIQNGTSLNERGPDESPADVLEALREEYRPCFARVSEMAFVLMLLSDVIDAANNIVKTNKAEMR